MTLVSIDVVRYCLKCGVIEDFTRIGTKDFCSECLADVLENQLMVPLAKMETIENVVGREIETYPCPCCGGERTRGKHACSICGEQDEGG